QFGRRASNSRSSGSPPRRDSRSPETRTRSGDREEVHSIARTTACPPREGKPRWKSDRWVIRNPASSGGSRSNGHSSSSSRTQPASKWPQPSAAAAAAPAPIAIAVTMARHCRFEDVADPLDQPADGLAALERVAAEAEAYLDSLANGPVRLARSDEAAAAFDGPLPEEGLGTLGALDQLIENGLDAHVRSSGPRFFHWVMGGATPAALGADWLTSLLDQNAGGWDASPLAARLELLSLRWLRELFGLPSDWDGVLVTGGQMANFTGLAAARQWWSERHGVDVSVEGLAGLPPAPVLTSGFVHVTGLKALAMLGLGRGRLKTLADGAGGPMDLLALERELRSLDGAPAIVIGNAGDVNTGLFDPLNGIADLCEQYGAWLHVDGAFGLFARVSPRTAEL